jgi:L-amino acid N-acyltransferase YncA
MDAIALRPACPDELAGLAELGSAVGFRTFAGYQGEAEASAWLRRYGAAAKFEARLAGSSWVTVAEEGDALLGFAAVADRYVSVYCSRTGEGIGPKLLGELLRQATAAGVEMLWADVHSFNEPSRKLFTRHGFTEMWSAPSAVFSGAQLSHLACDLRD